MCHPAIAVVLTLVTTAVTIHQQNQAADAKTDALEDQAAANLGALEDKGDEVTSKANLAKFERKKALQREIATTRVAQSEGGVLFGNTALRTMSTALMRGSQDIALLDKQETNIQNQIGRQRDAIGAGLNVQLSGLSWTSPLMAGLQGGTAGLNAYASAGGKLTS